MQVPGERNGPLVTLHVMLRPAGVDLEHSARVDVALDRRRVDAFREGHASLQLAVDGLPGAALLLLAGHEQLAAVEFHLEFLGSANEQERQASTYPMQRIAGVSQNTDFRGFSLPVSDFREASYFSNFREFV